jgi:C-methyltransferase C-terminal domain/Methyltransferase domain/Putative zinc binding domain
MFKIHSHCRACGYGTPKGPPGIKSAPSDEKLVPVLSLGNQALANAFAKPDEMQSALYPLDVVLCPKCQLAQTSVVVPASVLYSTYKYVTSKSQTMQTHFQVLWDFVSTECKPEAMVEIGSNDGDFLKFAKDNGSTAVCGIDPAENLVGEARDRGLFTYCGVFDEQTANIARAAMPPIDLVMARHVFCHVDDWVGFMKALDTLCHRDTVVVIEVPHVRDLLENNEFDTIYHEHLSYLNLAALRALLDRSNFHLHRVTNFPIHGGALGLMLRHNTAAERPHESVEEAYAIESPDLDKRWQNLSYTMKNMVFNLIDQVHDLTKKGKSVVGFGASAKSTVWLNMLGFTRKDIRFICDSTPQKWYCTSPGTDIPIVDEGALLREQPDYAIMFCWNFQSECLEKNKRWLEKGGRFIIPVPSICIAPQ